MTGYLLIYVLIWLFKNIFKLRLSNPTHEISQRKHGNSMVLKEITKINCIPKVYCNVLSLLAITFLFIIHFLLR